MDYMSFSLLRVKPLPTPPPVPYGERSQDDISLWAYTRPVRGRWVAGLLVALTAAVLAISIPQVLGWIIDSLLTNQPVTSSVWLGAPLYLR